MLVTSTGLELPWMQGLLPVVPLGFASRGMYNENSCVCVCTCPPKRTTGLCPLLLGLCRKASNCCGPWRRCLDQYPGKKGPSQVLTISVLGVFSAVPGSEAQGP